MSIPIEKALNIGPICGEELRSLGIETKEQLIELGWEEAFNLWVAHYPERIHAMACYALVGAIEDVNCMALPEDLRRAAKRVTAFARTNAVRK
ncbi:MAG: TfoX/Sxy family DNA transformation protein [Sumerlaeia bacterium]